MVGVSESILIEKLTATHNTGDRQELLRELWRLEREAEKASEPESAGKR